MSRYGKSLLSLFALGAFLTVPSVSSAQSGPEFKTLLEDWILSRCHMGSCSRFSIRSSEMKGKTALGSLYLIRGLARSEEYDGEYNQKPKNVEQSNFTIYVFCSKVKPATIGQNEGKWTASFLKPGRSDAQFGYNTYDYRLYYAACHNMSRDVDEALGKRLGYQFENGDLPEDVVLQAPEKALSWVNDEIASAQLNSRSPTEPPFAARWESRRQGNYLLKYIKITAIVDDLLINNVSINKGNCPVLNYNLPVRLKYGLHILNRVTPDECNILRVDVSTNLGNYWQTFTPQ